MTRAKVLKYFLVSSVIIVITLVLLVVALNEFLSTDNGSEWLISKAANSSPYAVSWQNLTGNIVDGVEISGLTLTGPGISATAGLVTTNWNIYGLLEGELVISSLWVKDVLISIEKGEETENTAPWPSLDIPISVRLEKSILENFSFQYAEDEFHLDRLEFYGDIGGSQVRINSLAIQQPLNRFDLNGNLSLRPPYQLNLDIVWQMQPSPDSAQLGGQASLIGDLSSLEISHELLLPIQISSSGNVQTGFNPNLIGLNPQNFELDFLNRWSIQNYAIPGFDYQISTEGELQVSGRIIQNQIVAEFNLESSDFPQIPRQSITAQAAIDESLLSLERLSSSSSLGVVTTDGEASWLDTLNWDLDVVLANIDLEPIFTDWDTQIDAQLNFQGALTDNGLVATTSIDQLQGSIRGYPLSGSGTLDYQNGRFSAENINLQQGQNQLSLQAVFERELEMEWILAAENLSALYPDLSGSLKSTGRLTGDIQAPELNASVAAQSLAFHELALASLTAEFTANRDTNSVSLNATELSYSGQSFSQASLNATGDLSEQNFNLRAEGAELTLGLSGTGTLSDQNWSSVLSSLNLNLESFGSWSLRNSVNIEIARSEIRVETLCLIEQNAEICGELNYAAATGFDLTGSVRELPASIFRDYWPAGTEFEGSLEGQVISSGLPGNIESSVNLESASLIFEIQAAEGIESYEFTDNSLLGTLDQDSINLSVNSHLAETGVLEASLEIPLNQATRSISGDLIAHFEELGWIDPFLPQLSELNGTTDISLQISGQLESPDLSGSLRMEKISAFVPELGINVENGLLNLSSSDQSNWKLSAGFSSGGGEIDIEGLLEFKSVSEWTGAIELSGEQLEIYSSELIRLNVSPQVKLQISPERIVANGDIEIPSGQITIKQLPDTTLYVSKDEVIVGETKGAQRAAATSIPIYADLNLIVGEEVYFEGFNIDGRLEGRLRLRETPDQPVRADGSIEIIDGTYTTYGQQLTIDPGLLVFNGAVDNPNLNVRAFRRVEDNLVGVQIGGTVRSLSSSLYSTPPLSSTETISLLITGRPITSASTTDGAVLVNAVTALGLSQSTGITQRLQNTFGLDSLTISSDESIEESAITIGKYLTPKIFISYARDIMSPNASFSLDYLLSEKFRVKAKSGASQSMDIFYRISH